MAMRRTKEKRRDDRWMAYHIAALTKADRMPNFEEFMNAGAPQSQEAQADMWRYIGDRLGKRRKHNPRRYRIVRSYPPPEA
jgi:hypothetical protein